MAAIPLTCYNGSERRAFARQAAAAAARPITKKRVNIVHYLKIPLWAGDTRPWGGGCKWEVIFCNLVPEVTDPEVFPLKYEYITLPFDEIRPREGGWKWESSFATLYPWWPTLSFFPWNLSHFHLMSLAREISQVLEAGGRMITHCIIIILVGI